jgi:translocator protein
MNNKRNALRARFPQVALNLAALAVTLTLNTLANTLPLGGRTTGEISDSFPVLFVPAGYVFSIWGLIYLGLIGFAVFQALPRQQANPAVRATDYWFAFTCLANALWIVFWHYGYYTLTLVVMLSLLVGLIVIYRRLAALRPVDTATRWLVHAPFSLYLGWISVATIANASTVLVNWGWDGRPLDPVTWTVILIATAAGLSVLMSRLHRDTVYAGVIAWALVGILVKQAAIAPIVTACALALLVIAAGVAADKLGHFVRAPARAGK